MLDVFTVAVSATKDVDNTSCLCVSVFLSAYSLALSAYFEGAYLLGMDVRTALIDTVYR